MKKIIYILLMTCSTFMAEAQYSLRSTPLADIDAHYIKVVIAGQLLQDGCTLRIEYGPQPLDDFRSLMYLLDKPDGKKVFFETSTKALNFLYEYGYKIEHLVTTAEGNIASYIMVKME